MFISADSYDRSNMTSMNDSKILVEVDGIRIEIKDNFYSTGIFELDQFVAGTAFIL